jgi:hypothetical protein
MTPGAAPVSRPAAYIIRNPRPFSHHLVPLSRFRYRQRLSTLWPNSPRIWSRILPRVASLPTDVAPKQGSLSCTWGLRTLASLSVSPRNQPRSLPPPPCGGPLGSPSWSKEQSRSTPRRCASIFPRPPNVWSPHTARRAIAVVRRRTSTRAHHSCRRPRSSLIANIPGTTGRMGRLQGRRDEDSDATSERAPAGVWCCRQTPCPGVATSVTLVAGNIAVVRWYRILSMAGWSPDTRQVGQEVAAHKTVTNDGCRRWPGLCSSPVKREEFIS